jgi:hypothetical protein
LPTPSTKEPQEGETEAAYQAFKEYLDSDRRRVGEHGPSARNWSMRFHWAHRARELDVYMSRIDLEEQVRSRRRRNERHRRMAAVAESKIVERLSTLTPEKIERMSAADATRLWDVAVRIERAATSAVDLDDLPNPTVSRPTRTRLDDEPDDDEDEDDGDWAWLMRHPFEARLAVVGRGLARLHERLREQCPETISTSSTATGSFPGATTAGIPTAGCTGTSFRGGPTRTGRTATSFCGTSPRCMRPGVPKATGCRPSSTCSGWARSRLGSNGHGAEASSRLDFGRSPSLGDMIKLSFRVHSARGGTNYVDADKGRETANS